MPWKIRKPYIKRKRPYKRYRKKRIGFGKTILPPRKGNYMFIREVEQLIDPTLPFPAYSQPFDLVATTDGGIAGNIQFRFNDLPNVTEFTTGLFKQYKLSAVRMTIYNSVNTADIRSGQTGILVQTAYNQTGTALGSGNTREDWNQVQRKRRFMLYKRKELYFKLNQLGHVSENLSALTGYSLIRPRWNDVAEPNIDHFGINLRFDSVDGTDLTTADAFPKMRIIYKYYFAMKGVK